MKWKRIANCTTDRGVSSSSGAKTTYDEALAPFSLHTYATDTSSARADRTLILQLFFVEFN